MTQSFFDVPARRRRGVLFAVFFLSIALRTFYVPALRADETPPPAKWIRVAEVSEEYDYVRKQRCSCGGTLSVAGQSTGEKDGKNYDLLRCACASCGQTTTFFFDVSVVFDQYKLLGDTKERQAVFERLDRQWPAKTAVPIEELKKLFDDRSPHVCNWAAQRLAETPAGVEILLDGYLAAGIMQRVQFQDAVKKCGPPVVALIAKRLQSDADDDARWEMIRLLGDIRAPEARRLVESQLRGLLSKPSRLRRMCYLSLGEHGAKESEEALLLAFAAEDDPPDDAVIWALGRCGTAKSHTAIRKYFEPPPKDGWSNNDQERAALAAIAAEGIVGDREAIPKLMEIAKLHLPNPPHNADGRKLAALAAIAADGLVGDREAISKLIEIAKLQLQNPPQGAEERKRAERSYQNARHNAIYALGKLGAAEAVPMMIECLREVPKYEYSTWATGIYGEEGLLPITDSHTCDAIRALTSIAKENPTPEIKQQIVAEYRRILKDDRFFLDHEEAAKAAAELGWRELVPDIVERLERDYQHNLELFGKEHEKFSPPLRTLTGKTFGEDPNLWREWVSQQTPKAP